VDLRGETNSIPVVEAAADDPEGFAMSSTGVMKLARASVEQAPVLRRLFCAVVEPLDIYSAPARASELDHYSEARFAEIIGRDRDAVWIATIDDAPVGFSLVEPDGDLWWFSWFGVTAEGRGHDVGRRLVENVLAVARARRIPKVWCDTRAGNTRSIAILRRAGFEKICDLPCHWFEEDYVLWQVRP
jgi:ribosomal protein S18 acetylase RimI-like enzyme